MEKMAAAQAAHCAYQLRPSILVSNQQSLSENCRDAALALRGLDFGRYRLPPTSNQRLLVWQGRVNHLQQNFNYSTIRGGDPTPPPPFILQSKYVVLFTDCLIFAKPVESFALERGTKMAVSNVVQFVELEATSVQNIEEFRNVVVLTFDDTTTLYLSFCSSNDKGAFLSKFDLKTPPPPATQNHQTNDFLGVQDIDSTDLEGMPTDAEIQAILERANDAHMSCNSLTMASTTALVDASTSTIPPTTTINTILRPRENEFTHPPTDVEVDELLKMAANVEGLLDLISPSTGYSGKIDKETAKALSKMESQSHSVGPLQESLASNVPILRIPRRSTSAIPNGQQCQAVSAKRSSASAGPKSPVNTPTKRESSARPATPKAILKETQTPSRPTSVARVSVQSQRRASLQREPGREFQQFSTTEKGGERRQSRVHFSEDKLSSKNTSEESAEKAIVIGSCSSSRGEGY
ncbi:hypothetical protein BDR26DRAFT_588668 [Obelidium mucronatum]|nr:hypothetical protein BDR26DRAFT_588668 [Obelidium mucronatum]